MRVTKCKRVLRSTNGCALSSLLSSFALFVLIVWIFFLNFCFVCRLEMRVCVCVTHLSHTVAAVIANCLLKH